MFEVINKVFIELFIGLVNGSNHKIVHFVSMRSK